MDLRATMVAAAGEPWTEERHSRFLNSIETTFVHQMLGIHPDGDNLRRCAGKLDRRVPDCIAGKESARTSQMRSPDTRHAAINAGTNTCNSTRRRSLWRYDASLDQVVPEFQNKNVGEDASKQKFEDAAH